MKTACCRRLGGRKSGQDVADAARLSLRFLITALALQLAAGPAVADSYEVVVEYDGPYFRVVNNPTVNQLVDDPIVAQIFSTPYGVAVSEEAGAGERIMNYVLDSGNRRVVGFETHMEVQHSTSNATKFNQGDNDPDEWNATLINLAQYAVGAATTWVIPHSEIVTINGTEWSWVADLTGFAASDRVYTIDYDAPTNGPRITLPAAALDAATTWEVAYCHTVNSGSLTAAFGIGDVDRGCSDAASSSASTVEIVETTLTPATDWQDLRAIFTIIDVAAASTDEVWVVDAADNSAGGDEFIQVFSITQAGAEAHTEAGEYYDDLVSGPRDVYVADIGSGYAVASCPTPSSFSSATIVDANQVTGHAYRIQIQGTVAGDPVTVTDNTTGRVLLDAANWADLPASAATTYILPGVGLTRDSDATPSVDTDEVIQTVRTAYRRYAFVADTGNDRIKVLAYDDFARSGDVLPGDVRACVDQPAPGGGAGSVAQTPDQDYYVTVPATVPENWTTATATRPIKEGSIAVTEDPDGSPIAWTRIDDLATAGPTDRVYTLDWQEGYIVFGDGINGRMPTAGADMRINYTTTPDVLRYGSTGGGGGQFSAPQGVAARWSANLGAMVVYVADTGNNRVQKLLFHPEDQAFNIPPYMEYVCEWSTASSGTDFLNGPTDIDIEAVGTAPAEEYFVGVVDYGNDRVVIYDDTAFEGPLGNATIPVYETTIGSTGTTLGRYTSISAVDLVRAPGATTMSTEMEVYVADAARGVITKYVKAPDPSITLTFTGTSALPNSYAPTGNYPFRYTVANCPAGGWVDFYYDTASTFNPATAALCFTSGSIGCSAGPVTWTFAASPGGLPADGIYYLFAILRDASGAQVASDATTAAELLTINSNLVPTTQARDAFDADATLLLSPGERRTILLQIAHAESVAVASFNGTFPATGIQIDAITQGTGWLGTNYRQHIWSADYDNTAGTFTVYTAITGSPLGLNGPGPHTMAQIHVSGSNALNDTLRFISGTFTVDPATSELKDVNGNTPAGATASSMGVELAYVGDIAHATTGTGGSLPHQIPDPDGYLEFEDVVAFTLGWNGLNNIQDPISDMGPATGTSPNLVPARDGILDVDDLMAFTSNWSWFTANGYASPMLRGAAPGTAFTLLGEPVTGETTVTVTADLESPLPGHSVDFTVAVEHAALLTAAMIRIAYDPAELKPAGTARGELMLRDGSNLLFHTIRSAGVIELCLGRLNAAKPGVSGSGVLASLTFEILSPPQAGIQFGYDLRDYRGEVLTRGNEELLTLGASSLRSVVLCQNYPNPLRPSTTIVFMLPRPESVDLAVYDLSGRRMKTLVAGEQAAGVHTLAWNGRDEMGIELASGVYFYQMTAGDFRQSRKLVITR